MAEMQWIKLRIDMFDDEKIKIIQSMPDGDALLVVWIRLIALAGKCNANQTPDLRRCRKAILPAITPCFALFGAAIRAIPEARKKKIRTLLNEFDKLKIWPDVTMYDRLHRLFEMAQNSDFLSGRNGRWGGCSFDWLINKTNCKLFRQLCKFPALWR